MTPDGIAELISNGQQASGMTFTPKALQLISLAALGLPYLASLVGQHAGFAALDRQSATIDHSDVDCGIGQVLDHLDVRIPPGVRQRMEQALGEGQADALGRLAQIALANSFRLPPTEVDRELKSLSSQDQAHTAKTLATLKDHYRLLGPIADDPTGALSFVDDGVPLYLWVRLMHGYSRDHRAG